MATIGTKPNLIDVTTRLDKDGKIAQIAEILTEQNEILQDAVYVEANDGTGHKTTIRSGLPQTTWRQLNYGVQPSKSTTVQIKDSCGMLEAYSEIDKSLADLNSNTAEFRLSEDTAFLESMAQQVAATLLYGNTASSPEKFMGLAPRYNSLSAANARNIVNAAGSTALTSVWLVVWGANTAHMIYPKGSKGGLTHQDLGEQTLLDAQGGKYQGYRAHYKHDVGFVLRDWRYVVRIANIDTSALKADMSGTSANLVDLISQAIELVPNLKLGKAAIYCNRTISSFLRRQVTNKSNVRLSLDDFDGKKILNFDGIPVRRVDEILNTEVAVS